MTVVGMVEAADMKQAVSLLRERKLLVISIIPADAFALDSVWRSVVNRVGLSQLTNFTRQLSTMISAGLNLVEALSILENQTEGYLGKVIGEVRRGVESGQSLAKAMEGQGDVFSRVYISLITAGEKAGVLDKVLLRLSEDLERQREFRSKIKGALLYPAIIFVGMLVVMGVMVLFVIPQLGELYQEFDTELPFVTQVLIGLSNFASQFWWLWIVLGLGGFIGFRSIMKYPETRRQVETFWFSVPVFGYLNEQILVADIARTLAMLGSAGVPIVEALDLVASGLSNTSYREGVDRSARLVEKGFSLAQAFGHQEVFPPVLPQMLSVGEETGRVDEILQRVSLYFQSESEQKVKGLTTAIEPLILIILGVGVGFLVFAVVMPIYNLTSTI
jgi:type IV pilus assembly protein PilC